MTTLSIQVQLASTQETSAITLRSETLRADFPAIPQKSRADKLAQHAFVIVLTGALFDALGHIAQNTAIRVSGDFASQQYKLTGRISGEAALLAINDRLFKPVVTPVFSFEENIENALEILEQNAELFQFLIDSGVEATNLIDYSADPEIQQFFDDAQRSGTNFNLEHAQLLVDMSIARAKAIAEQQ